MTPEDAARLAVKYTRTPEELGFAYEAAINMPNGLNRHKEECWMRRFLMHCRMKQRRTDARWHAARCLWRAYERRSDMAATIDRDELRVALERMQPETRALAIACVHAETPTEASKRVANKHTLRRAMAIERAAWNMREWVRANTAKETAK